MDRTRIIGYVSGKGGVGKTTLCVNTAVALNKLGKDVTVADADFSASNLATYLGKYDHPVTIQDVLAGMERPQDAIFQHPTGIQAMTSSNEVDRVDPDTADLRQVLESAGKYSDYVLVDCPPGLNRTVIEVMDAVDEVMIVTEPTQTAGVNAAQVTEKAMALRKTVLGTVLNKFEDAPDRELVENEIEIMTNTHVLNKIPHDETVKESLFENLPVVHHDPLSEASIEIQRLAASMEGQQFDEPRFTNVRRKIRDLKKNVPW